MKRLIAMISTEGKSQEEMKAAARQAIQQYLQERTIDKHPKGDV
jgi:hypothetical protein